MSKKIKIFLAILVIIIGFGGLYLTMNFKKVLSAVSGVINVSARLAGVSSPVNSNDAATKAYVDAATNQSRPEYWTCQNKNNVGTTVCDTGYKLITGGCDSDYAGYPINNGWQCSFSYIQAYAWCCK